MSIFDLLKSKSDVPKEQKDAFENYLQAIIQDAKKDGDSFSPPPIARLPSFKAIKNENQGFLLAFLYYTLDRAAEFKKKWNNRNFMDRTSSWPVSMKLAGQLLKLSNDITDTTFQSILHKFTEAHDSTYYYIGEIPYTIIFDKAASLIEKNGLTENIVQALKSLTYEDRQYMYGEHRKINEKINFLLQGTPKAGFNKHDEFGKLLTAFTQSLDATKSTQWSKLFNSCITAAGKAAPSQKWLTEIKQLIDAIGPDAFTRQLILWLEFNKEIIKNVHKDTAYTIGFLQEENHALLKGLIWCAGIINNAELNAAMDDYAGWAFKKKPNVGPISARTGSACMHAFEMLPFKDGISKLVKFKMKVKNNTILKTIDKIIATAAEKNGVTQDAIMELGVPDFGINQKGELITSFEEYNAVYTIKSLSEAELLWEKDGKLQKAVPQQVKTNHAAAIKSLKAVIKEIEELLPIQKERIERLYLNRVKWRFEDWYQNYIQHPLVSIVAKKLIWHFANSDGTKGEGIFTGDHFINAANQPLSWISNDTTVELWHPIGFTADYILQWRNYIQENQIKQPFKQAYREIYILTDAEINTDMYSNRFAAHILRQHQFVALCKQRGWSYHLMGQWDSHNTPVINLPKWNMSAQYYVDADWNGEANPTGVFSYISTDQVRFYKDGIQQHLYDVPAMVFTEIMRDVDLFVGVTSIGNDPNWQNNANNLMNTYWHNYSFGDLTESAKVRADVLKNLVPRLKIAGQCSFDGKYMIVKGKLRKYKIHMGSGNILMEPNDQYLCIVPERSGESSTQKLFLPFEGDNMLSIIISKALLLAEDDKIKDSTIVRQIAIY